MRVLLVSRNSHFSRMAEPRKRPMQQRSRELVERILDAAARIFDAAGYHDTTTNHVADEAGVSVGSLYQYFPNKDALLVGLADRHLDEVIPAIEALAAQLRAERPDAATLSHTFITAVAELNRSNRLHGLLWAAPRTEALGARIDALEAALAAVVEWHLVRLGHAPTDAARRATMLVTVFDAAIHAVDHAGDRDRQIDELVRLATLYVEATGASG